MTKKQTLPKWTDERTEQLTAIVGDIGLVAYTTVVEAAEALETSARSVASKLRKIGYDVESSVKAHVKTFTDEEAGQLVDFVSANEGQFTYAEIAQKVFGDAKTAKQVQGKMLSMELSSYAKKAEAKVVVKKYTDDEENTYISMANAGAFLEDIAEALDKPINSVRGKGLALMRSAGIAIPKQRDHKAKAADLILEIGDAIAEMTVEDIAEKIGKSVRGVKTMLTYRGVSASNYDGAARAAKNAERKEAA